jgi:protein-S-isoprenylcysteine O-methyltransferase Ste14
MNSMWVLLALFPALLLVRYAVIAREERYLESLFGEEYASYRRRVRRWL